MPSKKEVSVKKVNWFGYVAVAGVVLLVWSLLKGSPMNNNRVGSGPRYGQSYGNRGVQTNQELITKQNCLMDECLLVDDAEYPVGELSEETAKYLDLALADERKARDVYEAVMGKFGRVRPFVNIARAEEQHITALLALYDKYGVEVPVDVKITYEVPATLTEACSVGVQAEIDNDALYQSMIDKVTEEDVKGVFERLASASLNMHLPAFERCAN